MLKDRKPMSTNERNVVNANIKLQARIKELEFDNYASKKIIKKMQDRLLDYVKTNDSAKTIIEDALLISKGKEI